MTQINFKTKEIVCKVVYCGPVFSGKKTSLEFIHRTAPKSHATPLVSLSTDGDTMIFFDYTPSSDTPIGSMTLKLRLCTLSGYVHYRASKRRLMEGADAMVFVADSQAKRLQENIDELEITMEDLRADAHLSPQATPHALQWNKRDQPQVLSPQTLSGHLNEFDAPAFETVASKGVDVMTTLEAVTGSIRKKLVAEYGLR